MSRWEYQTLISSGMSASELLGKRRYILDDDMSAMGDQEWEAFYVVTFDDSDGRQKVVVLYKRQLNTSEGTPL